jgi:RNA polymerase sigma-70 factor, ECF subfamily
MMSMSCYDEHFLRQLIDAQRGLYTYILRLLPRAADANDVLQETNLVILRKGADFQPGTDFGAWAATIAHFQVLSFRLKMKRERLCFDEELINQLAAAGTRIDNLNPTVEALDHCKDKLSAVDRDLLEQRYGDGLSVAQVAASVGRAPRAISQALYRIRLALMDCIQQFLASREGDRAGNSDAR